MSPPAVAAEPPADQPSASLLTVSAALIAGWRRIVLGGLLGAAIAAAWALLATPRFRSTAEFAPEERTMPSAGGLAALAGQLGAGALAGSRSIQFYAGIATGREVLQRLALDSFPDPKSPGTRRPLLELLGFQHGTPAERLGAAVDFLQSRGVAASTNDRTGTITIAVVMPDARLAAEVTERLFQRVEQFNQEARRSSASERRKFAEQEQNRARAALSAAESDLRSFLEVNRGGLDSPRLAFQRDQLQRRIDLLTDQYSRVAREAQDARTEEVRETPVFTLVESPQVPIYRDFPRRTRMTIIGGALGAALVIALIAFGTGARGASRLDPTGYAALRDALSRRRAPRGAPAGRRG